MSITTGIAQCRLLLVLVLPLGDVVMAAEQTQDAANPAFNYYGRWQRGATAITINSGSLVEFAYSGSACSLLFDVKELTRFPAILVQVDNGAPSRTTLAKNVSSIAIEPLTAAPSGAPPASKVVSRYHLVRFWVATHSLFQTSEAGKQWATLEGGCKFLGARIEGGDLVPLPYGSRQIEFLGDSITQGLRLLFTGADDITGQQNPCVNWPQLTADLLGMKPIVTGFGGQGISATGTCGAPAANAAFPFLYKGAAWSPAIKPKAVVIYHGANDGIPAGTFQAEYLTYLQTIRLAYPDARIVAVCPHGKGNYAPAINAAVQQMADARIVFLDYSSGVISPNETSDTVHLNPGGAIRLATRLAKDLQVLAGDHE